MLRRDPDKQLGSTLGENPLSPFGFYPGGYDSAGGFHGDYKYVSVDFLDIALAEFQYPQARLTPKGLAYIQDGEPKGRARVAFAASVPGEIQIQVDTRPVRKVENGVEWEYVNVAGVRFWQSVNLTAPPGPTHSTPAWLERFAGPYPLGPFPSEPTAPPEPTHSMPDWLKQFAGPYPLGPTPPPTPPTPPRPSFTPEERRALHENFSTGLAKSAEAALSEGRVTPLRQSQPSNASLGERRLAPTPPRPAPITVPDWTTQTEWASQKRDSDLFDPVTSIDTGNRPLNFLLNKVVVPWRNLLAGVGNVLPELLGGIDNALKHSPVAVEYEHLQYTLPLEGATLEIGPALGALGRILGSALKSERVISAVKAPAFWAVGADGLGGGLAKAGPIEVEVSALGSELKSAVPPATFPSLAVQAESSVLKGTTPYFKGIVGEERTIAGIREEGGVLIGEHVTFVGPTGQRTTIDVVWVDAEGFLRGTEAKFGEYAGLTKPQSIVFPQGGHLTLTPVGARAAEAGLTPGQAVGIHVDIARWLF